MTQRVVNFSAGPAILPESVLRKIAEEMVALPGVGSSILEVSHRGPVFTEYLDRARNGLRSLLAVPEEYEILFLQGGSRLQFSMIPMNFLPESGGQAAYLVTGSWGKQAYEEAGRFGKVACVWSGEDTHFSSLPGATFELPPNQYDYLYYVSNETIQGVQFQSEPASGGTPLICDASSDFLHKPLDIGRYSLIYACAQKNAGPAGLTIVVARRDLLDKGNLNLPGYLDFRSHAENQSLFNTPPTFAIYVFALVLDWLQNEIGGLEKMYEINRQKAALLYEVIDRYSDFYQAHAQPDCRSLMNVVFRFSEDGLQKQFLQEARELGLTDLAGHRSVGGIRASIYNAMPLSGVQRLADFMSEFAERQSAN